MKTNIALALVVAFIAGLATAAYTYEKGTAFDRKKDKVLVDIYNKLEQCEQNSGEQCYLIFLPRSEAQVEGRPA